MYLPPAFVASLPETWIRLTSISIVKGNQVDQAVLIDLTGASVWGKAGGLEVQ